MKNHHVNITTNKNDEAIEYLQSFIEPHLYIGIVFLTDVCLKCTIQLCFLAWRIQFDHICYFLGTQSQLSVLAVILDFKENGYFIYFDINCTLNVQFHVQKVICNNIRFFVLTFPSVPVLRIITMISFCSHTNTYCRSKPINEYLQIYDSSIDA